ncbi:hypothetical protein CMK13_14215 [Candidatus Poribacteria bacterium]|nr:hypothetical protein [Candidatus Poribacteria bacterium]OUV99039.1 MAG: hypothetical protein CBD16_09095 [Betaproteobacteria bacterium TMED156]
MNNIMKVVLPIAGAGAGYLATAKKDKKTQNALIGAGVGLALTFLINPPNKERQISIVTTPNQTGGKGRGGRIIDLVGQLLQARRDKKNNENSSGGPPLVGTTTMDNFTFDSIDNAGSSFDTSQFGSDPFGVGGLDVPSINLP